jgi:hypothetical protein
MTLDELKYPIGRFERPTEITDALLNEWIAAIATFPVRLTNEVAHLSDEQLDTPYRPDGWTLRQVVHHCADSHMNSLMRLKLALTEDQPTIKPYFEDRWAALLDSKMMPITASLQMIEGIHARWVELLTHLTDAQKERTFLHPETGRIIRVDENIGIYAWHCNHHLAHITATKKRNHWK